MRYFFFLISIALLSPAISQAAIQGGFPSQSVWVSEPAIVEGETIVISTVVYSSVGELRGTLVFSADGTRIGVREFELPGGESQIHSIEWKPKKGEYQIRAQIEGTSAELSQRETPTVAVSVAAPPPPSQLQQTAAQVVRTTAIIASSSAPIVLGAAQALFAQTEALRNAGIKQLENYLTSYASSQYVDSDLGIGKGTVAGASTSTPEWNTTGFDASKGKDILSKIGQAAAAAALFTLKSMALFYPLLALSFLGLLYFLSRRIRRNPD